MGEVVDLQVQIYKQEYVEEIDHFHMEIIRSDALIWWTTGNHQNLLLLIFQDDKFAVRQEGEPSPLLMKLRLITDISSRRLTISPSKPINHLKLILQAESYPIESRPRKIVSPEEMEHIMGQMKKQGNDKRCHERQIICAMPSIGCRKNEKLSFEKTLRKNNDRQS
jgi:hypothetical protein